MMSSSSLILNTHCLDVCVFVSWFSANTLQDDLPRSGIFPITRIFGFARPIDKLMGGGSPFFFG